MAADKVADKVLVVDDDIVLQKTIKLLLESAELDVITADDGFDAIDTVKQTAVGVAIVDLGLPGISGMETIQRLKEIDPDLEMIVLTGMPSLETSIEAIQEQVSDYLLKPCDSTLLIHAVRRAAEHRQLIITNRELVQQLEDESNRLKQEVTAAKRAIERQLEDSWELIGQSDSIRQVRHFVAQVAPSDITVLITGESGTGKDVVARLIHEMSGRDPSAFVKINCPAIPETLLESELFGHEPGAFTGAEKRKPGRFELASGGTILLDEIGDLPLKLQGKLLEVIEHQQFPHACSTLENQAFRGLFFVNSWHE